MGLERAHEADTTGAKGGLWSPKAGLGKVSEVWAFKRPYTARGGARARVGSSSPDGYRCSRVHYRYRGVRGACGIGLEGESKQRRRLHGRSIHPLPPPGAGAPLDPSGERERLAAAVDPASEGRWVRKSVRG